MEVSVELSRVLISEASDQQYIVLKEMDGDRRFPIVIGTVEAVAIERRLKGLMFSRPLTHDLLANAIEELGGTLEKIVVDDLRDGTFFAKLHIRQNGHTVLVDSRPSDAIALGVASAVPIFVEDHVLKEASGGF